MFPSVMNKSELVAETPAAITEPEINAPITAIEIVLILNFIKSLHKRFTLETTPPQN